MDFAALLKNPKVLGGALALLGTGGGALIATGQVVPTDGEQGTLAAACMALGAMVLAWLVKRAKGTPPGAPSA